MSVAAQIVDPQSASLALTLLQSKAGNRWARAVEEMKASRLRVAGDFPEFIVTNKSGTAYKVRLDPHGSGSCTCPDFQVRIAQDGRICKHIAAAAITALAPQVKVSSPERTGPSGHSRPRLRNCLRSSFASGAPSRSTGRAACKSRFRRA